MFTLRSTLHVWALIRSWLRHVQLSFDKRRVEGGLYKCRAHIKKGLRHEWRVLGYELSYVEVHSSLRSRVPVLFEKVPSFIYTNNFNPKVRLHALVTSLSLVKIPLRTRDRIVRSCLKWITRKLAKSSRQFGKRKRRAVRLEKTSVSSSRPFTWKLGSSSHAKEKSNVMKQLVECATTCSCEKLCFSQISRSHACIVILYETTW